MPRRMSAVARWAALVALSAVLVGGLEWLRLPAALLLGSLAAAAALAAFDAAAAVPAPLFAVAQAVVGCLIARSVEPSSLAATARDWPLFLVGVLSVIGVSVALGWLLARLRILPGTTAVWGAFPGAATVMTLMADGFGADVRLVALMQYLRVVMVAVAATAVASLSTAAAGRATPPVVWLPPVAWGPLAATAALAALSAAVGDALRIPAGPMLIAFAAGAALEGLGVAAIELPPWLLAPAYLCVGWSIGARFDRPILAHAARVLPALAASIACLIAICAALAAALAHIAGVDLLTAYLAMSPGGVDSVAIIAAATGADARFVMGMQMARFLTVLIVGPAVARFVATRAAR